MLLRLLLLCLLLRLLLLVRCGHCKHLVPEYKKLGEAIAKDPSLKNRVVIAKVCGESLGVLGV